MRISVQRGGLAIAGMALAAAAVGAVAGEAPPLRRERMDVVCSKGLFRDVSTADAVAAGKVWISLIGRRRGYELESQVEVVPNGAEIRKRVMENRAGLLLLDSVEYLSLVQSKLLEPLVMIAGPGGEAGGRYQLLVSRDSGMKSMGDLRGRSVNVYSRTEANLGVVWLETELDERRLGRAERFFGSVTVASKPSSACLAVFFGRAAGCVIDSGNFEVMKEMNPQLGNRLQALAVSAPLVEVVVALHAQCRPQRADALRALLELDRDPEGRQVLTMFKASRTAPVSNGDLEGVREVVARYQRIPAHPAVSRSEVAELEGRRR